MTRPTTHWHGIRSVSGPVDPSGCCADQSPACDCNAGRGRLPTGYPKGTGPDPARCSIHGDPTAASIAAGFRAQQDGEAADRLAKGLRGGRG